MNKGINKCYIKSNLVKLPLRLLLEIIYSPIILFTLGIYARPAVDFEFLYFYSINKIAAEVIQW